MTFGTNASVVAVDIGGSSIKGALVDADGGVTAVRRNRVADIAEGQLVDVVCNTVDDLLAEAPTRASDPVAIGLSVCGLVDEQAGVAVSSMLLGWRDVPFRNLLKTRGLPIAFLHDVSAGAYAEASCGAAVGHDNWLFLALGTGLGATFVLNGRPYRGSNGRGGELAHVVVRPDGPRCRCGKRGCAEMLSSADAVMVAYNAEIPTSRQVSGAAEVVLRLTEGDPVARRVWDEALKALADVVATYVESMNPSTVVVGGGLSEAGELLLRPLHEGVLARVAYAVPRPTVRRAAFGQNAALVGAGLAGHRIAVSTASGGPANPWPASESAAVLARDHSSPGS